MSNLASEQGRGSSSPHPDSYMDLISDYMSHKDINVQFGGLPAPFRERVRSLPSNADAVQKLDAESRLCFGSLRLELMFSYASEPAPDCSAEAIFAEKDVAHRILQQTLISTGQEEVGIINRGRATLIAAGIERYFDILRGPALAEERTGIERYCQHLSTVGEHALKAYSQSKDPALRKHLNVISMLYAINRGFVDGEQDRYVALLAGMRHLECVSQGEDYPIMLFTRSLRRVGMVRAGVNVGPHAIEPVLLNHRGYGRSEEHGMGAVQAMIDLGLPAGQRAIRGRSRGIAATFMRSVGHEIVTAIDSFAIPKQEPLRPDRPDRVQSAREWYFAHLPVVGAASSPVLEGCIEDLNEQRTRLSPGDKQVLAGMRMEAGLAEAGHGMTVRADKHYTSAEKLQREAAHDYTDASDVSKSLEARFFAASVSVYRALMHGTEIASAATEFRNQTIVLAERALVAYPGLTAGNRNRLDCLLQELTFTLLVLRGGFDYLPLPGVVRERGDHLPVSKLRHHAHTFVHVIDDAGTYSVDRRARFRYAERPDDASLDNGVFTMPAKRLRPKPGAYPLLEHLLQEGRGYELSADTDSQLATLHRQLASTINTMLYMD